MPEANKCRICFNETDNKSYSIREMQFGTREEFEYSECSNCGALQIKSYPSDPGKYYPDDYGLHNVTNTGRPGKLIGWLREKKLQHVLDNRKNLTGFILNLIIKPGFEQKLIPAGVKSYDSILDIGSGAGKILLNLRNKGFKDITGTDIFINNDLIYDECLRIYKKDLSGIRGQFDFIMMNHSLEHMPEQDEVFRHLRRLIKPGKMIMIRIPVKTDYIWNLYGVKWGSLDAPRHFYLHTLKSMEIIAERNNFRIEKVIFDSGSYQFYSSEQIIMDISLRAANSYYMNKKSPLFSRAEIRRFGKKADELNRKLQGDCACFYLKPF
ncbi:MAG: class I SAM-dependent methyltransferase [Bacteroidales bacterium]